ncbi:MAG TPA: hypothetical protein VMU85_22425 [Stellaceae bacterium]|nr:hypothetical protein [Stellaceae bacterium]
MNDGMIAGHQSEGWRGYYEQIWAVRATFMRSLIAVGETSPYRVIKQLEAHQRKFSVVARSTDSRWEKQTWPTQLGTTPAGTPAFRLTSLRGNVMLVPYHARDNLHNFIIDYLAETGPYDAVIELGCGYGQNLFEIFYNGGPSQVPYFGGELTESGVAMASELAALEPRMQATFFRFDHLKPDFRVLPPLQRALVFTVHSLEQVELILPEFFLAISRVASAVTALHFEPFGFQVADLGPASQAHREFITDKGWNVNFAASLSQACQQFGFRTSFMATEMFLPHDAPNPTSLAIWHSGKPA